MVMVADEERRRLIVVHSHGFCFVPCSEPVCKTRIVLPYLSRTRRLAVPISKTGHLDLVPSIVSKASGLS